MKSSQFNFDCWKNAMIRLAHWRNYLLLICGLLLLSFNVSAEQKVTLAQIETKLRVSFAEPTRNALKPILKAYNKQKSPKALAYAQDGTGPSAIGISDRARSPFVAAQAAIHACDEYRTTNNIVSPCEVVLLDSAVIKMGRLYKAGTTAKTPSSVWRISDVKTSNSIYLAGTIHVLKPTLLPLPDVYDEVFNRADRLALETNPLLFSDPERIAKIQTITHVEAKQVKNAMNRKLRKKASKFFRGLGATKDTIFNTSPGMLSTQIQLIKLSSLGFNINTGVDAAYARQASVEGKAILEVEDFTVALAAITDWPMGIQMKILEQSLLENKNQHKELEQLVEHWLRGEIHQLYALARRDLDSDPALKPLADRIYDERNLGMLDQIEIYLDHRETTTVMVGAGHLGGPKGLVTLLNERGYLVQQLNHAGEPI